ncbi:MAG: pentose kinase [Clostridiales Family XIII bacterium]|jgi:xylulokinase|nr:pentose kinase [Clostridiales Family XIII bacterium]
MNEKIIIYDIGTSGVKSTLYEKSGAVIAVAGLVYPTYYPSEGRHEQAPHDWWAAVVESTRTLIRVSGADPEDIVCASSTGHCFGAVPIGRNGALLRERVPIWSDSRSFLQGEHYAEKVGRDRWYTITGRDFPISCAAARILWYAEKEPELCEAVWKYLPTKDYINFKLTGICRTDPSDASGSGVYSLRDNRYSDALLDLAGICGDVLPEIIPSAGIVGELTEPASKELGLPKTLKVICGGNDTCCMALGAKGFESGRVHTSLGSSAFIALTTAGIPDNPEVKPNIFTHVVPGLYVVTRNLHSAGNAFRWVRDVICPDLVKKASDKEINPYDLMTELACESPIGANKLIFYPTLAMGGPQDRSIHTKGAFTGLDLMHDRKDLIRASMEGIAMNLAWNLDDIRTINPFKGEMLLVGGGSGSALWRQIFADLYRMPILQSNIGQDAGTLGAMALAAVGMGFWKDFGNIDQLHETRDRKLPIEANAEKYDSLFSVYKYVANRQSEIGDRLFALDSS